MDTSLFAGIYQEMLRAWPNRWLGFFVALVLSAAVAVVVIALPDQYKSQAKVYINSEVVLKPLLRGMTIEDDSESQQKFLRVFQSTLLNDQNVSRLVKTPGMGFDAATATGRSSGSSVIKSGVTILDEGDSNLFSVSFVDSNPNRAKNVVDGLLSLFIETNVVQARNELQAASAFLDKQIAEYEVKVRDIEAKMAAFRVKNVEVLGEPTFQARLTTARTALRDAQLARQVATETRNRLRAQIAAAGQPGGAQTALLNSDQAIPAVIDRLSALQTQLNQLLLQYTEKHPDVLATRREIALLSEQYGLGENLGGAATKPFTALPGQVPPGQAVESAFGQPPAPGQTASATPVAQPVSNSADQGRPSGAKMQLLQANFAVMDAEHKVEAAQTALDAIDQYSGTAPEAEAGLEQLTRDYTLLKENYDQLLRRRESARMTQARDLTSGTDQFRVIEAPTVSAAPSGPDRSTLLLLGSLLSVGAGTAFAYSLGLLRGTFVSATEAERELGLPVIARLSNTQGILTRVSQSADALALLGGVAGIFITAVALSATTGLLTPLRTEIYRLIDVDLVQLIARLF